MPTQRPWIPQIRGNPWQSFEETDRSGALRDRIEPPPLLVAQRVEPPPHHHENLIQLVPFFADIWLCAALAVAIAILLQYVNGALW